MSSSTPSTSPHSMCTLRESLAPPHESDTESEIEPLSPPSNYNRHVSFMSSTIPLRQRVQVFIALIITQTISNYDSGACAVLLAYPDGDIVSAFNLTPFEVGALLSCMYAGHTVGCIVAAQLILKYQSKYLLCVSLCLYCFCLLGFGLSVNFWMSLMARFIGGFVSAFIVVYGPVWVDDFGAANNKSLWMSLVQAGVPLGVMLGYVSVGFVTSNTTLPWRYPFLGQSALLLLMTIYFLFTDDTLLNRPAQYHAPQRTPNSPRTAKSNINAASPTVVTSDEDEEEDPLESTLITSSSSKDLFALLSNPTYVLLVGSLCSLYFVVNGLQMWVTSYLLGPPILANKNSVVAAFGVCSATGPVMGVLFGGWIVDRFGGYRNAHKTAIIAAILGFISCVCSIACLLVKDLLSFGALMWLLLFFGGAVVPAAVGMSLSTVGGRLRPLASGVGSCTYNFLGFFLGPFVCGAVSDSYGVVWGFRTVMSTGVIAVLCMTAVVFLTRNAKDRVDNGSPSTLKAEFEDDIRNSFVTGRPIQHVSRRRFSEPPKPANSSFPLPGYGAVNKAETRLAPPRSEEDNEMPTDKDDEEPLTA